MCGAEFVVLAPESSCRRTHGSLTLDHHGSAASALVLGVERRSWRRALFARSCRYGHVLSGGARRRAALSAPLSAAPRSWSLRRQRHAAALTEAPRSAAAAPRRRLSPLMRSDVIGGELSLCEAVGAVASSLGGLAVARLSLRRYQRRRVRGPCAGVIMPPHSRRRYARPPLLRGDGSRPWRRAT